MKNNSFRKWLVLSALFGLMCISPHLLVRAQSIANYAFSTSTSGTLEDLSTGATSIMSAAVHDDDATVVTALPFNFVYMGVSYSHFSTNSNGQFLFHTSAGATAIGGSSQTPAAGTPLLFPMSGDNELAGGIRYKVIGSAPNRKFVLEWTQFYVYFTNINNAGNMQLWLNESNSQIDFVYGAIYNSSSATVNRSIGITTGITATTQGSVTVGASPTYSGSATFASNTFAAGSGTTTGSPLIANIGTSVEGTRRVYSFTPPPIPNAPTALTFSSIGTVSMVLNWVDNASAESGFRIFRSLDGVSYTLVGQVAPNTTGYSATGLSASTLYYWKVLAFSELGESTPDLLGSQSTNALAGVAGVKTVGVGGDYQNLTTAFAEINGNGLTGNVELQLITGYPATPETYPILSCNNSATGAFAVKVYPTVSGLSITSANATGTLNLNAATNLTFDGRVNQSGASDLVISNTNVGASYAVQFVNDAKSNTLQYLTIHSANNSTSSGTIVFAGSTGTTGNDNNVIDHCDIKDGASTPWNAIYSSGTSTTVDNSGNTVSNSNIYNYFNAANNSNGVFLSSNSSAWTINANKFYQTATRTLTSGSQHRGINITTSSGNGYVITNNVIGYASSTGTGVTTYTASAGRFFGIELTAATTGTTSSIQGNTISGISLTSTSGTTTAPGIFAGISVLGGNVSVGDITPNIVGASSGTGAITVSNSANANIFGIHATSTGTLAIVNNVIGGITGAGNAAGVSCGITAINTTGASTATTVTGNTIGGSTANSIVSGVSGTTTAATTVSGIATAGGVTTLTVSGNTVNNMTNYGNSTTSLLRGIFSGGSPTTAVISNNTVSNLTLASGTISNIEGTTPTTLTISGNAVFNATVTGNTGTIHGINQTGGTTSSLFKNKIYSLTASGTGSAVNGILASGGTTVNIYNNVIGDLKTPTTSAADPVRGISVTSTSSTTNYRVYYNSIYLNASSTGTNFGTSGVYHTVSATATTAALDLRNNMVINESTPAGTGITAAFRRSNTALGNFASTSNRNELYAGVPSATHLLLYDGTNSYQTIAAYQTAVLPREANSFTGEAAFIGAGYGTAGNFFISTTPSNANYLKPVAGITTQAESGGVNITTPAITDDYAAVIRQGNAGYAGTGTAPDLGAFEFEGVTPTPVITLNSVTPAASVQCTAASRLVSVNITTTSGTITGATIGYSVNGVAQTNIVMTNTSGATWQGTIPVPTPVNATIAWGVAAINSLGITGTYTGTSYADEPLLGATTGATATLSTVCANSPTSLKASLNRSGSASFSASSGTSSSAAVSPFYHTYGGAKTQYIYRASELTAMGFSAGNITDLSLNITTLGTTTMNGFTINIGHTAQNAAVTNTAILAGLTQVYSNAAQPLLSGTNTFTFSTPFNWDGTSNIVVSFNYSNNNTGGTSSTIATEAALSYTSSLAIYADNATAACLFTAPASGQACMGTNSNSTSSTRPYIVFTGNKAFPIQAISWSDGATTVGTTNPLTVNPTTNTTYTATITAAGCTVTPAPTVSVTVNPLPATPTAVNSAQCGVQVPTAHVTSTSGLPTPTFNWYTVSTGGTASQSSTSTTYTSTVAATTTFYVSELNTVTGCESVRVPVTVTVSTPDQVSLTPSVTAICVGGSFTLTAANINPTPFQNYTYSTQCVSTGSGAETPLAGTSLTVTPTAAGSFTYTLTGVDGGCAATATATVTVNALPVITSATATPATLCSGSPITLTATTSTLGVGTGSTPIGTQTTTEFGGSVYRNGYGTGDFRHQLVFTAAELSAAGLQAGNITAISFNVTGVGSGSANNYNIKLGNTSATASTATFLTDPTSSVYNAATYTAVAGVNTHTFSTPFNWNGTSNILIEICYNISVVGSSHTVAATTPASNSNVNLLGAAGACTAAAGTTYANRPLVTFSGQVLTNLASLPNWSWTPGTGLNTAVATTSITNNGASPVNQAFTVTLTHPTTGCVATATTSAVTINPAPASPVANNGTQCGVGVPTASVTGSGIPGNTYSWYLAATGGTALSGETGSSLSSYSISATTTFYVSEGNGTCSSGRTAVTATVTPAPAITIAGTATICNGGTTALTASSSNDPNYTYTWSGGLGTGATVNASPTANTTYTVTAVDASGGANNGCTISATYAITVNPLPTAVTANSSLATICSGTAINLTSSANANTSMAATLNEGFETFPPTGWTMTNAGSGNAWESAAGSAHTGSLGMRYKWNTANPGNAWAITPQLFMLAGQTYNVSFWYKVEGATFPEKLKVTVGNATTVASQTTVLWNNNGGASLTNTTWAQGTATYTPTVSGNYYVGFNCYSDADKFYLHVDDVSIQYTAPGAAPTYAWTSSPAGFTSSVQNPTNVAPTVNTTYTVTATNSLGCSNSASVSVVVNNPSTSSATVTECDSYLWNGTNYTTSGVYTHTSTNSVGCDSVATLNLTIKHSTDSTISVTNCSSYTWAQTGLTYNTSGLYRDTIANAAGCDSVITLNLTINMPSTETVTATGCGSYTWALNGQNYTTSGSYTHTIQNSVGCDSVVTLNLTMGQPNTGIDTQVACETFTWIDGVEYTASTNTPTFTLTNASGCDSVVTLHLTINQNTGSTVAPVTACGSYTWPLSGQTYTTSGTHTHILPNAAGCDSVITLNLTINPQPVVTITNNGNGSFVMSSTVSGTIAWLNCATNTLVSGATTATFTPTANGSYAAIVTTVNGCSDTSACMTITNVGIKENSVSAISVHPNPTHDFVIVTMEAASATVEVFDAQGKLVQTTQIKSGDQIDLGAYERGVYTLKIKTEIGTSVERIVKN